MHNLWHFQFRNFLSEKPAAQLATALQAGLQHWQSHGTPVQAKVSLRYGHFLFIEALTEVSGCAIDWLQHTVLEVFKDEQIELLDNSHLFFWSANQSLDFITMAELEPALLSGKLTPETIVFDPAAIYQADLSRWEAPLQNTWLARYLQPVR